MWTMGHCDFGPSSTAKGVFFAVSVHVEFGATLTHNILLSIGHRADCQGEKDQ